MADIPQPTFDDTGDISDQTEEAIATFAGSPRVWLEYCASCWDKTYGKIVWKVGTVEFITGGWSCNECVISAMQKNTLLWTLTWESSHRGGLYCFTAEDEGNDG
jgi:hypothetical protein